MARKSKPSPAKRLDQLLASKKNLVPFEQDIPDKEYPQVRLSIYGAVLTNELFISITNGRIRFVDAIPSPLFAPAMADRIFGMDASDAEAAFKHADKMWKRHRDELLRE